MTTTIEASPIAHGRTAFADFRPMLLAHPEGWFNEEDVRWVQQYLISASVPPEALRNSERWLCVGNERMTVFGILTTAEQLSPTFSHEIDRTGGREVKRRLLHAFVGFVVRGRPGLADNMAFPRDLQLYRDLYEELFEPRWREELTGTSWERATLTAPRTITLEPARGDHGLVEPMRGQVEMHPVEANDAVWRWASTAHAPAVVLNVLDVARARESIFSVCTTADVSERVAVARSVRRSTARPVSGPPVSDTMRSPTAADFQPTPAHAEREKKSGTARLILACAVASFALLGIGWSVWLFITKKQ